jgi:hypothetical protein
MTQPYQPIALIKTAHAFFGIGMLGIGLQHFIYSDFRPVILPPCIYYRCSDHSHRHFYSFWNKNKNSIAVTGVFSVAVFCFCTMPLCSFCSA